MLKGEEVLIAEKPDIVLVQGDNAVLVGPPSKLHIAVGQAASSHDKTMPEEINWMVADVCTNLFCTN